jgi:hypothetical protein
MKTNLMLITIASTFFWSVASAQESTPSPTPDETTLNEVNTTVEEEVKLDGAEKVRQRIADRFEVSVEDVEALRAKKMGYGEITLLYSLAKHMEGGATQENIDKILELRNGETKMGWGQVAKKLDLRVGTVAKDAKKSAETIEGGTDTEIGSTSSKGQKTEKGNRPEKAEKSSRPERAEKPSRPEKPDRPDKGNKK